MNDDISDPSDFMRTSFPQMSELDSMLRCLVCKDFLKSPVLTTCGHVFCSLCIRRSVSNTSKCPLCSKEIYESGLKKILLLDGISNWFSGNRTDLLDKLSTDTVISVDQKDSVEVEGVHPDKKDQRDVIILDDEETEELVEGQTKCPICQKLMSINELQTWHLDICLSNGSNGSAVSKKRPQNDLKDIINAKKPKHNHTSSIAKDKKEIASSTTAESLKDLQLKASLSNKQRLPNLDTTISTNKLKAQLTSYKLPTVGTRTQLENRLKEYITLYNANLDSLTPVRDSVLLDRLAKWEYLMNQPSRLETVDGIDHEDPRQQERQKWMEKNNNAYNDLIAQARNARKKPKTL